MLISIMAFGSSCGENKNESESVEVAEEKNEEKFDDGKMEDDREFLVKAASGGLMEVELGKMAQTQGASAEVKKFGQQMVTDHSKANEELKTIAANKNITVPSTPGEDAQEHINELKEKRGADFDKAYMNLMVDDHQEDVNAYEKEANSGDDADIKAFAAKIVPTLKQHLDMAKTLKDKVNK